jgi:hypothetical protein
MSEEQKWLAFIGEVAVGKLPLTSSLSPQDKVAVIALAVRYSLNQQPIVPCEPGPTLPEIVRRVEGVDERVREIEHALERQAEYAAEQAERRS